MATIRSVADLLYLFRDDQTPKSVTSAQFQDLIASLHPSTGNFQDLPTSAAGLARGRIYLNGDMLQVTTAAMPALLSGRFAAAASASISATVRARRAARSVLGASDSLKADAIPFGANIIFEDQFNTLSLYDQIGAGGPGTWYPVQTYAPTNAGSVGSGTQGNPGYSTWVLNPLNPATPIAGAYSASGGNLRLLMQDTPAPYSAACGGMSYIGQQLIAPNIATYGRFEARLSVPALNGTLCSFFLISNSGGTNPVTIEVNMEITTSSSWSPRTQWQFAVLSPGYAGPPLGVVYSWSGGMPTIDVTQMNVYAFEMRPTYVACLVNGTEVMRVASPAEFGNVPWSIYLEQIDGGANWTGPMDASPAYAPMLVDYVRVTQ